MGTYISKKIPKHSEKWITHFKKSKIHWRPFNLSACATLVHELANPKKWPLNLSTCATLVHEVANPKKWPLNLSTCVTLVHELANAKKCLLNLSTCAILEKISSKLVDLCHLGPWTCKYKNNTSCMALFCHVAASGRPCMAPFMVLTSVIMAALLF